MTQTNGGALVGEHPSNRQHGAEQLTDMQQRFVALMAKRCRDPTEAARRAGSQNPKNFGSAAMRNPKVKRELQKNRAAVLEGDIAGLALDTMRDVLASTDTPANVRFQASKWVLENAGHGPAVGKGDSQGAFDPDKPLNEMSLDELQAYISAGNQALKDMKAPRDVDPSEPATLDHEPTEHGQTDSHSAQHSDQSEDDGSIF